MERSYQVLEPGKWLHAYSKTIAKDVQNQYKDYSVQFVFDFIYKGKKIATHQFFKKFDITHNFFSFNILPDPDSTQPKSQRWDWSGRLAAALAALPKGQHDIDLRGYVVFKNERTLIVKGTFGYNNKTGNGKMAQYAQKIDKERSFDINK